MRVRTPIPAIALTVVIVLVLPAIAMADPPRPGTEALLASDMELPRHTVAIDGGSIVLQGGVTRDPDVKPTTFGDGRFPIISFVRVTNETPDTVAVELDWRVDADTEFPVWSRAIPPGRYHVFYEPTSGVPDRVPMGLRVYAADRVKPLGRHKTVMRFDSRERHRLMKSIPNPYSGKGTEESFGHGRGNHVLSGWPEPRPKALKKAASD
jgi:hypothetical protein